jgi:hypothetical protein
MGWNQCSLENRWIKLHIAPQLGGRIIQLEMDGHEFFFVNRSLAGKEPDSTRLAENGRWLNFGGEKIWPAPQGWNSLDQWPGPPDPVLDSGIYSLAETTSDSGENGVILTSPVDNYTGLQIEKKVFLSESRSEVIVHATFCNKSKAIREWAVWPVCQMNTSGIDIENQSQIICPVNPKSKFINGYKVMHGLVNNPQYQIDPYGNMVVNYQYLVGKIGLDTDSNWTTFLNKKSGKVFVLMFQPHENKSYPDDTNVQIWSQGKGMIYSRNKVVEYIDDKELNPPYMEIELLSPLQEIQPGESIQFEYRMLTCTIPENGEIRNVNQFGVVAAPLQLVAVDDQISVTGKFGVFMEGNLKLRVKVAKASVLESWSDLYQEKVSPFNGIDIEFKMNDEKCLFDQGAWLSVGLFDQEDCFVGEIDKIELKRL